MKLRKVLVAIALTLSLACALPAVTGCRAVSTSTNPTALAPGYISQADQQMKGALDAAAAFYNRLQTDSAAGRVALSQAEKDGLNRLGAAINTAQPLYLSYHNGMGSLQAAQAAVDAVSTQQKQIQALGVN